MDRPVHLLIGSKIVRINLLHAPPEPNLEVSMGIDQSGIRQLSVGYEVTLPWKVGTEFLSESDITIPGRGIHVLNLRSNRGVKC